MNQEHLDEESTSVSALEVAKQKTREYARGLWDIVSRYSRFKEIAETTSPAKPGPETHQFGSGKILSILSLAPYLLCGLFLLSFFWDFDQLSWVIWGYSLHFEGILRILSVSGLIGYLTNWLAITMLFRPAKKRPILGHGLVPAQKDRIAFRLAQAVSEDLINPEIIKQKISDSKVISRYREQSTVYIKSIIDDPSFREELKALVVNYVNDMIADSDIRTALAGKILVEIEHSLKDKSIERVALKAYSYIKGQEMQQIIEEALVNLPASVESGLNKVDDFLDQLPSKLDEHSHVIEDIVTSLLYKLINRLDVHTLVEDNLKSYDEQRLSDIIKNATNEQLRYIQYLGAVLGMIGGLVIWEPLISVAILGTITGLVIFLDNLLMNFQVSK